MSGLKDLSDKAFEPETRLWNKLALRRVVFARVEVAAHSLFRGS